MNGNAIPLPWTMENVPHAVLDILRGCNIRCRDCYNLQPDHIKPLAEIKTQLDTLQRLRKLQSVSIVGGEITLHPELVEIVSHVRQRGLFVELFSNGVELDEPLLTQLQHAGANVVFLHIEPHQRRTDLPVNATPDDLRALRESKAALVASKGIEVGLAVTIYPDRLAELEETVRFVSESPHISYLLVTFWRDVGRMPPIFGDLDEGMFAETQDKRPWNARDAVSSGEVIRLLESRFALTPFGYLGSNMDSSDPRWLSYMTASLHQEDRLVFQRSLKPTWVEKWFLEISRRISGRYPFYQPPHSGRFRFHLLLNGLAGGCFPKHVKLVAESMRPGARLGSKRLLFQWPASLDAQGRLIHCDCCPDAVLRDGHLVPLCISDLTVGTSAAQTAARDVCSGVSMTAAHPPPEGGRVRQAAAIRCDSSGSRVEW